MVNKDEFIEQRFLVFFNFAPNHIFGAGEARHVKCRVLIDTKEC